MVSAGLNLQPTQRLFNQTFAMTCCADEFRPSPPRDATSQAKPRSGVAAYLAFLAAVVFTLLAVSALVTSDFLLPWLGLWS